MTTYYPAPNEEDGLALSARLWDLVVPVKPPGSLTTRLYAVVQAVDESWHLEVPDDHATMHLAAELTAEQIEAAVTEIEKLEDATP